METYKLQLPIGIDLSNASEIKITITPHPKKTWAEFSVLLDGKVILKDAVLIPGANELQIPLVLK